MNERVSELVKSERNTDMRAKIVMIIMAVALIALPAMAQQQEWKSTSVMQGTGSTLAPQVTEVGASSAAEMGTTTTTETYSPAKSRPRKGFDVGGESGRSDEYPIGDAVLPMLLMAVFFAGIVYYRRKKDVKSLNG